MAGVGNLVNEIEAAGLAPSHFVIIAEAEDSPIQTPKRAQGTSERTDSTTRCRSQMSNSRPLFLAAGVTHRVITDSKTPCRAQTRSLTGAARRECQIPSADLRSLTFRAEKCSGCPQAQERPRAATDRLRRGGRRGRPGRGSPDSRRRGRTGGGSGPRRGRGGRGAFGGSVRRSTGPTPPRPS